MGVPEAFPSASKSLTLDSIGRHAWDAYHVTKGKLPRYEYDFYRGTKGKLTRGYDRKAARLGRIIRESLRAYDMISARVTKGI